MRTLSICGAVLVLVSCTASPARQNNLANQLVQRGDYVQALDAYQAAQVAEPDNAVLYFNAAVAYTNADELDPALAALDQAIERGDETLQAAAYYNLGNIYLRGREYEAAVAAYKESLRRVPDNPDARFNLELASAGIEQPTPTAVEMQTNLDTDQVNPQDEPTPNPGGQELPTPTPTPPEALPDPGPSPEFEGDDDEGDESSETEATPIPRPDGEMTREEADLLLDELESESDQVTTFRDDYNVQGTPQTERDW